MEHKTNIIILVIAIILVGGYLTLGTSSATVSAQGTSVIEVLPDKVSINLNIQEKGETAQEAKDAHDVVLDKLMLNLLKTELEKKDIKTTNFNVYPEYIWDKGKREQLGFIAQQSLVIETSDFSLVSNIVDIAIDSDTLVSYINFELSEEKQNEYKARALEEAGKDAKIKAEAIASGVNKKIGTLVSVQSQEFNYFPYRHFEAVAEDDAQAGAKESTFNLAPTDIEVRASISVEYKLRGF